MHPLRADLPGSPRRTLRARHDRADLHDMRTDRTPRTTSHSGHPPRGSTQHPTPHCSSTSEPRSPFAAVKYSAPRGADARSDPSRRLSYLWDASAGLPSRNPRALGAPWCARLAEAREPPADGFLQDPRRLVRPFSIGSGRETRGRRDVLGWQPRVGRPPTRPGISGCPRGSTYLTTWTKAKYRAMIALGAEVLKSEFPGYDDTEVWARRETAGVAGRAFLSAFDDRTSWPRRESRRGSLRPGPGRPRLPASGGGAGDVGGYFLGC